MPAAPIGLGKIKEAHLSAMVSPGRPAYRRSPSLIRSPNADLERARRGDRMRHRSSKTPEPDPWSSIPVVANQWRRMLSRQSPGELDMAVTYVCRKCGGETKRTVKRA